MLGIRDDRAEKQIQQFDTLWEEIRQLKIENLQLRLQLRKLQGGDGIPAQYQVVANG